MGEPVELGAGDAPLHVATDIVFEDELKRNPYELKVWWAYLQAKKDAPPAVRFGIFDRAVKALPGSYKLWWNYLRERRQAVQKNCITDPSYEAVNELHERALIFLSKMPVIWLEYLAFLWQQRLVTRTRRAYDKCLRSLPITQHDRVWVQYIGFIKEADVEETALAVFRRYLMLEPDHVETYIAYLCSVRHYDEAATLLANVVNDESFVSMEGKTNHQLWMDLCELITKHPKEIKSLQIEAVLRSGLRKFTDEVGRLWCSLADHFVRLGQLEKARDVYEEAVTSVTTVHDFALVFDAFAKYEEFMCQHRMEDPNADPVELDMRLARLEHLMDRRPELLSSVKLRQNPHNVLEWLQRTKLYGDNAEKVVKTFAEAAATINPQKAVGKLHLLWLKFAQFYEGHEDLDNARVVLEKATKVNYRGLDDLASVWCEWIEMELRNKCFDKALEVARQALHRPRGTNRESVQARLHRSVKLWALCADVEESLGTLETAKACYEKMIELKVATPQLVIHFAHMLEEHKYYEESFKAYEKGVALFSWPHLADLWLTYLAKFVARYGGRKLERARDLFEQAVSQCPEKFAKPLYLLYARLEEEHGLARHALAIYERACQAVPAEDRLEMYRLYIAKTAELFGVTRTRKIYESAIEALPDAAVRELCRQYANMERALGEVDRARAILQHCSQFCDPNREPDFWREWREFEVAHGNEDTFRDMLRVKRSVQAQFSRAHYNVADLVAADGKTPALPLDPMAAAEQELAQQDEEKKRRAEQLEGEERKKRKAVENADVAAAEEEYRQMQAARQRDVARAAAEAGPDFMEAPGWQGSRLGYVFKMGDQGLGYYKDTYLLSGGASSSAAASAPAGEPARKKTKAVREEIDVDLEEAEVPAAVFGGLADKFAKAKEAEREEHQKALQRLEQEEREKSAQQRMEREKEKAKEMGALSRLKKGAGGRG